MLLKQRCEKSDDRMPGTRRSCRPIPGILYTHVNCRRIALLPDACRATQQLLQPVKPRCKPAAEEEPEEETYEHHEPTHLLTSLM